MQIVKKLRNVKGLKISKIQRTIKVNWRTVKKYAEKDQQPH